MNMAEPALMRSEDGTTVPLVEVVGTARADGLLLQTTLRQRYVNRSGRNVEAAYTFPLPHLAVLLALEFTLGERRLAGKVFGRKTAERAYENAIDDGDSAVLLERTGDGLYTVSVGNLMAGEEATVEIRYGELLSFAQGQVRIAIPTTVAPRHGSAAAAGVAAHAVPDVDLGVSYPARFSVEIAGALSEGAVSCPSHPAQLQRTAESVVVSLDGHLDRDFVVVVDGLAGRPMSTLARDGDGWVALASFLPALGHAIDAPLTLKVLVDCSGSMAGDSIAQARSAVARLVEQLAPEDRISVSAFGSRVVHAESGLRRASAAHRAACLGWADALQADLGGTEIEGALVSLFEHGGVEGRDADVLMITDGETWAGDAIVARARAQDQRVFIVAVGASPAESLLSHLAQATGGSAEFVTPNESIEAALLRLFARLRQPRANEVTVRWPAPVDWQAPLPGTLFAGETLHALARFAARPDGEVTLAWRDDASRSQAVRLARERVVARPDTDAPRADALPRVAAGLTVATLPEPQRGAFAERYQLVTADTSMVLVLERNAAERAAALPQSVKVKQMVAAGWGGVGSVARTGAPLAADSTMRFSRRNDVCRNMYSLPADLDLPPQHAVETGFSDYVYPIDTTGREEATRRLAEHVNRSWRDHARLPDAIADVARLLPNTWVFGLQDASHRDGVDGAMLLAWLLVELTGDSGPDPFDRAALREARRLARKVPEDVASMLRLVLAT